MMFAPAIQKVLPYTRCVIVARRLANGQTDAYCATYIVLNNDGFILTAAHVLDDLKHSQQYRSEVEEFQKKVANIKANQALSRKRQGELIARLNTREDWITDCVYTWDHSGASIKWWKEFPLADLALAQLEPFDPSSTSAFPIFHHPADELLLGTSICRLGYSLNKLEALFDEDLKRFTIGIEGSTSPPTIFPTEGIYARKRVVKTHDRGEEASFFETSSTGLQGQSGGPIFDTKGHVIGLQSRTIHYPLGPVVQLKSGKKVYETPLLKNVGVGVHVETIVQFLEVQGVNINIAPRTLRPAA